MGSFCPNNVQFQLKKCRRVISPDTEQWCKVWINLDLVVSKLAWGIGWTFIKALKNLKICTLMGSFCPKHNVSARKFQRNYLSWHWKVIQNFSENRLMAWKMTRNLVNFHASNWNWQFALDGFLLSKGYKVLHEKVKKSYLSWHWRVIQTLKKDSLFIWKMTWEIWCTLDRAKF